MSLKVGLTKMHTVVKKNYGQNNENKIKIIKQEEKILEA